jgi:fido (protein-threonine AMPylation protein)
VAIHPFPNGNGRWSRLAADALVVALGEPRFSWGAAGELLTEPALLRQRYIAALQAADAGDVAALMIFARS